MLLCLLIKEPETHFYPNDCLTVVSLQNQVEIKSFDKKLCVSAPCQSETRPAVAIQCRMHCACSGVSKFADISYLYFCVLSTMFRNY